MASNSARTERCLASIKSRSRAKANVILLVGRLNAGKSSLAELVTGATGLSSNRIRSETDACQIIDTRIDSTEYFIVDTPGFEDQNKWQVFCEIMKIVQDLHNHAVFGVWYLFDNTRRGEQLDKTLLSWLAAFCGNAFCPSLTIVTTFWRGEGAELGQWNERLNERLKGEWAEVLGHGASTTPLAKREELVSQAQEMVRRYCHGTAEPVPLVLQELHKGTPLEYVSAARVLRPVNQNDQNQHWNQDTPSSSPYDAANSQLWNGTLEVVRGVVQGVAQGGIHYHAGGGAVGTGRQGDTRAQSIFGDPHSSRDTAISYGRSGDYRAREGYYNDFGLDKTFGKFTGSADQGNALRRAMHENWGRS
ncbi:hypothetical protein BDV09DRAFT_202130 [Aspergillus tetrazonus]